MDLYRIKPVNVKPLGLHCQNIYRLHNHKLLFLENARIHFITLHTSRDWFEFLLEQKLKIKKKQIGKEIWKCLCLSLKWDGYPFLFSHIIVHEVSFDWGLPPLNRHILFLTPPSPSIIWSYSSFFSALKWLWKTFENILLIFATWH